MGAGGSGSKLGRLVKMTILQLISIPLVLEQNLLQSAAAVTSKGRLRQKSVVGVKREEEG